MCRYWYLHAFLIYSYIYIYVYVYIYIYIYTCSPCTHGLPPLSLLFFSLTLVPGDILRLERTRPSTPPRLLSTSFLPFPLPHRLARRSASELFLRGQNSLLELAVSLTCHPVRPSYRGLKLGPSDVRFAISCTQTLGIYRSAPGDHRVEVYPPSPETG